MKSMKRTVLVALAIALPVLGGGYLLAKKVVWPRYKEYRAASFERSAREFLEKGDYENAMLFVRKNLAANQQSAANWRLAAEVTEKRKSPQALYYRKRLTALEPTLDNRLKLIRLALDLRADSEAAAAADAAGPEARDSAEFHELAARAFLRAGNPIQAKFHLITLCELRPENRLARLDLAEIRLGDAGADTRTTIRSEIRALATDSELRTRALTLLLNDSIRHDESRDARELAVQLRRDPALPVTEGVVVADALARYDAEELPPYLEHLKQLAADKPADIARVGLFLIAKSRAAEAKAWLATLPAETRDNVILQRLAAAIHADLKEWPELEAFLRRCNWKESEFERLLLVAMAQLRQGNDAAFGETWRLALTSAGTSTAKLDVLRQRTTLWGWADQRIEVLWRLFQQNPRDTAIYQQLYAHERVHGNTANLNRLFARLLEVAPADINAKNNFAYTALLLGQASARAVNLAREAHAADPKNPYFATTYALALLRSGQPAQARTALESIDSFQLWQPERALIQAAVFAATGNPDEADTLLATVDDRTFLPEEKALLGETRTTIAQRRRNTARDTQIAETVAATRGATAAKSVLTLLPPAFRAKPTLQMELADSLYARDEFASLAKEVDSAPWENNDFLRLALLAYAQRRLDRNTESHDTWRLAVNTVGTRPDLQRILATLAGSWNWEEERMDALRRVLSREPGDQTILEELVGYYTRLRRTGDLARIYNDTLTAPNASATNRAHFAYYSLLVGTNSSEAHVAAKTAFDQNPSDPFAARALALSLWRQGQARAGLQILGSNTVRIAPGTELSLVLALLHEANGEADTARQLLVRFPADEALPEEKALADDLARKLAAK
jgi:hypothetical protein